MNNDNKRIFEIGGAKFEVDLSNLKRIDTFKIGDSIKVLINKQFHMGVIVDIVGFKSLPSLQIAYFKNDYWGHKIEFCYLNEKTENIEILPASEIDLKLEKSGIVEAMQQEINKKRDEMEQVQAKLNWFLAYYGKYFSDAGEENK